MDKLIVVIVLFLFSLLVIIIRFIFNIQKMIRDVNQKEREYIEDFKLKIGVTKGKKTWIRNHSFLRMRNEGVDLCKKNDSQIESKNYMTNCRHIVKEGNLYARNKTTNMGVS